MSASENNATPTPEATSGEQARLLYCHCAFAKVVPDDVKQDVLRKLSESGAAFDAVPDLCEMSARKDPALARLAASGELRIVACYPRAVKWLFHAAKSPLPENGVEVLNMRTGAADEIVETALRPAGTPAPQQENDSQESETSVAATNEASE